MDPRFSRFFIHFLVNFWIHFLLKILSNILFHVLFLSLSFCVFEKHTGFDIDLEKVECRSVWTRWADIRLRLRSGSKVSFWIIMGRKNKFLNIFPYSFCIEPASVAPFEWPDDITKWPKCRKKLPGLGGSGSESKSNANHVLKTTGQADHMVCEVIGHPCCIGK